MPVYSATPMNIAAPRAARDVDMPPFAADRSMRPATFMMRICRHAAALIDTISRLPARAARCLCHTPPRLPDAPCRRRRPRSNACFDAAPLLRRAIPRCSPAVDVDADLPDDSALLMIDCRRENASIYQ